jgi:hypothetical protein
MALDDPALRGTVRVDRTHASLFVRFRSVQLLLRRQCFITDYFDREV